MPTELDKQLRKLELLILAAKPKTMFWEGDSALLVSLKALLDCRSAPTWLKNMEGRFLYLSPSYCHRFNIPTESGLGHNPNVAWGGKAPAEWQDNDQSVVDDMCEKLFVESTPLGSSILVRKWPVIIEGVLVGVAGEVVDGSNVAQ